MKFWRICRYFSLLAQRNNQKKRRPAPRFFLRVAETGGPFKNSTFSLLPQRKSGALAGAKGKNDKRFLESIESMNGVNPTISIFGEQIASFLNGGGAAANKYATADLSSDSLKG